VRRSPEAPGGRIRVMRVIARMNVGGPAMQVAAITRGLPPEHFDQRVYCGAPDRGEADYVRLAAPDLPVRRVPGLGRPVRPGFDAYCLAALVAEMRRFRPHIVHTHTAKAGALGRTAAVLARVPARVHTFHGHLLHGYFSPRKTRLVVAAERALATVTDRLVAVGVRVRDDLLAAGVGDPGRFAVVPPGTRLGPLPGKAAARRALGLPEGPPVVAYVGRLTGVKRPDRFVEVARAIHRELPEVRFAVCGEGDLLGEVLAAAADLDGTLHPLGWRADVETVYAAADLVLLTSDNEGMPVSLIEAGLAGLPAVATRVGGVPEVIRHEETGLLAPPWARALAAHAVRLLRDEPARLRMGRAARAWATQRFTAERLVADTRRLYTELAVERGWWPPAMLDDLPEPFAAAPAGTAGFDAAGFDAAAPGTAGHGGAAEPDTPEFDPAALGTGALGTGALGAAEAGRATADAGER
jgi:glycosyltransferase involved in cell wall biosynthesis